jgi:cell fate (sporulation/competence/biofilm development) regulator YlbF (YheA/YmcA/DUF963 family)
MTNLKFPDATTKEWQELKERSLKMIEEFKSLREAYTNLYEDFPASLELEGKRQSQVVYKLRNYPGDITPTMFASLIKEVESNQ